MDITITAFPRVGVRDGNKVAKLSTIKETTLRGKYSAALSEITKAQENVKPQDKPAMPVATDYNALIGKLEMETFTPYAVASNQGARKLKVNPIVKEKTLRVYDSTKKERIIEKVKEEPHIEEEVPPKPVVENKVEPLSDTRVGRLERTGEIPVVNDKPLRREDIHENSNNGNDIINAPSRFVTPKQEQVDMTPYDSIIHDNPPVETKKEPEARTGGDPNLYNKLIHGGEDSGISIKLKEARSKLTTAEEEKEKARAVNRSLEKEVENVRATIEKIKRERDEKVQKELDNTLNMLQSTKEEILSETRKYDNLQEELAELMRQRDALLSAGAYQEESYTRSH